MKTKNKNRIFSLVLSAMLSIEQIAFAMPTMSKAASSAKESSSVHFPAVSTDGVAANLNHEDSLFDNGDGTYTFTSVISADYTYLDVSESRLKSKSNYYELKKPGKYLIELWGGDGGDGSSLFPVSFLAGKGGQGGFVYGTLNVTQEDVDAGKKLYYEVGSKGASQTRSVTGGGTDGLGGGAGDIAVFSVGAGGGYSAVYLLDGNETISDSSRDDPKKVLMIAGGGGGGGAGASIHSLNFLSTIFGGEGKANGGDGGYEKSQLIAAPSIGMFKSGKYYSGEDGSSSGTKGAYVGQGGTDRPGEVVSSFIGFLEGSSFPNDWQKTYHAELERGAGGAGNFRGGGGGAGFAGGSGGLQNEPLDARNVGGGGGGSSYIGSYRDFEPFDKPENTNYFIERSGNDNADVGGAVVITYMSESSNYDYLNDVKISADISKYFDIVPDGTKCVNKIGNSNQELTGDKFKIEDDKINITGSVEPISNGLRRGQPQNTLTLTLKLKPKEGFAGGNDVPIFDTTDDGRAFTCTENKAEPDKTCYFLDTSDNKEKDVSHVNVPYNLNFAANSMTKGIGDTYTRDNLKNTPVSYESSNPMHDFIKDIQYSVLDESEQTFSDKTVAIEDVGKTYNYQVKATITPNNNLPAKVGDAGSTTITKTAKVRCVEESPLDIDGFYVTPKKSLIYNENDKTYDLDLDLKIKRKDETIFNHDIYYLKSKAQESTRAVNNNNSSTSWAQTSGTYTIPADGWYYLQTWGGNGGTGGDYLKLSIVGHDPGTGGTGGYVAGYAYLRKGQIIDYEIGSYGDKGIDGRGSNRSGGYGGAYSELQIDNVPIMIAGGGAGGNAIYFGGIDSDNGANGASAGQNYSTEISSDKSVYNGSNGIHPEKKLNATNTDNVSQPAGKNYLNTSLVNAGNKELQNSFGDTVVLTAPSPSGFSNSKSVTGGRIAITRLATSLDMTKEKESLENRISDFLIDEEYSQYFDVQDILINGTSINSTDTSNIALNIKDIVQYSETFTDGSGYSSDYYAKGDITDFINNGINKNITVKLKPKTNLVGGNDIPLLNVAKVDEANATEGYMDATTGTEVSISHSGTTTPDTDDDTRYVKRNDGTDWANVEIKDIVEINDKPSQVIVNYNGTVTSDDVEGKILFSDGIDDFVTKETKFVADEHYTKDGMCSVVGAVTPSPAEKAVYIAPVEEYKEAVQIPVKVMYTVRKVLTNIKQEAVKYSYQDKNTVWVPNQDIGSVSTDVSGDDMFILDEIHDAYVLELTAADNYDLPSEKKVTVKYATSGAVVEAADVVKKDGMIIITIPASAFTDNINITASGAEQEMHKVVYMYEVYDPLSRTISMKQDEDNTKYVRGAEIVPHYPFEPNGSFPTGCDGYTWDWPMNKEDGKYKMGETDVYVVGRYKKITYKLKIEYVSDDPDFPAQQPYYSPDETRYYEETNTFDIALTKDAEFYRRSPDIPGYVPDKPFITLKVTDEFITGLNDMIVDGKTYKGTTETVTYTKVPDDANVIVNFVKCDVSGVPLNETSGIAPLTASGPDYNLDEQIEQELADWELIRYTKLEGGAEETVDSVSGTLATGESATYYVYFREKSKTVTVEFYAEHEDDTAVATRKCVVGREYGYDKQENKHKTLPKAEKQDMRLVGWENEEGVRIEDDSIVSGNDGDVIKLYAVWAPLAVEISVEYKYAMNATPEEQQGETIEYKKEEYNYGSSYNIPSPTVVGYSPDKAYIEGYAFNDEMFNVYYINDSASDPITITVNVYSKNYDNNGEPAEGAPLLKGGEFELVDRDGNTIAKSNTNGTMTWTELEAKIAHGGTYTVRCTASPLGYGACEKTITLNNQEVTEYKFNIFLDKSPFQLPFAGSTPMTGYTVFGISTMLLAGLLLFLYVSSKSEEKKENE